MPPSGSGRGLPIVMIKCPVTGDDVPTGFTGVSEGKLERVLRGPMVVKCESCGEYHEWSINDAFLRRPPDRD